MKQPRHPRRPPLVAIAAIACLACGQTGQHEVRYPILAVPAARASFAVGAWQVTLSSARVALGPIYFCATSGASADLCPAAVAELADSASIDLLRGEPQALGEVYGLTGTIRSATYDFGLVWLKTTSTPQPTPAAPDGHSAAIVGTARRAGTTLRFVANVDVLPVLRGSRAVQGARADAEVRDTAGLRAEVAFDVAQWFSQVDFDALAADATRAGVDVAVIERGSTAHNAIVIGMTVIAPPTFVWASH